MTGTVALLVLAAGAVLGTAGCCGIVCWFSPYSGETLPGVGNFYIVMVLGGALCILALGLAGLGF